MKSNIWRVYSKVLVSKAKQDHNMSWLIFIILFKCSLFDFPTNPCYIDNEACDTTENNLIDTITDVRSLEECRGLCYRNYTLCNFFTFYGPDSFPLSNICMILSSCDETFQSDGCHSEDSFCFRWFDTVYSPMCICILLL